jgi:colicin import membrane protein
LDVLEQEIDALKSNKNRTEESLQAATEKLVKLTEDDSPEWRQMVEELVRAMPALEKTQEVLAGQRRARKAAETAKSKEPKKPLSEKLKDLDSYLEGAREIKKAHTARKLAAKKEAAKKAEDEKAAKAAAAAKAKADANKKK